MNTTQTDNLFEKIQHELFSGWKPFEVVWLGLFLVAQIIAFILQPDTLLGMIAGISGIICVVFAGKGKISNYFFGLIFAYSYFYVSLGNNYLGEMNTTLYVYIPAQFIGYFLWKENMQSQDGNATVVAKSLDLKGWGILIASVAVGSLCFISALNHFGGSSAGLDGVTTVLVVAAQLLMILRYREQWALWIVINILSMILWGETPAMYLMYGAYLLNSLYGYYNWTKLQKA
ncbi:Nicotinamide riboside transporter pnuC [Phocoenobacter uteri]|uniref:Nicotinamide riboside transporter PnuC n=1 Tax=Phocoenobacter uteri TaxID=146806 RepID=A0A379CAN0_9PAST|nr:nicotinamide riboside transporter PnuC [Phocoenobacter uteri]MDG6881307.1 nicotinamide riboside transporter pnuC [Phocoenobacter uteri]SUB59331.1 Nicotinamide riboside transporter pnuC [Phocoenobacter uteri]